MFGYIYETKNLINGRIYVGKKEQSDYDKNYYGSGTVIKQAIKKYGKTNFSNKMIDTADTLEELNQKELYHVKVCKETYGDLCYNIAEGGTGGNALYYMSEEQRQEFKDKMTIINTKRSQSKESRDNIRKKLHQYFEDHPEKRIEQSKKVKAYWTDEKRKEHGKKIKARPQEIKDKTITFKPCVFILNDIHKEFKSVNELRTFLKEEYNYNPDRRSFMKIMSDGAKGIPYKPFHKNKFKDLFGMIIYHTNNKEDVSTSCDEFNSVGQEISTCSKSKATVL